MFTVEDFEKDREIFCYFICHHVLPVVACGTVQLDAFYVQVIFITFALKKCTHNSEA